MKKLLIFPLTLLTAYAYAAPSHKAHTATAQPTSAASNSLITLMAQGASVDEIEKAIAQGADVNATEDGITPLMRAASTHSSAVSAELTRVLLANPTIQKSLNALTPFSTQPSGISHQTALAMATANGYVDTVKLLCSQPGIDPNIADSSGYTPLM